jgi:hypothetical protein
MDAARWLPEHPFRFPPKKNLPKAKENYSQKGRLL